MDENEKEQATAQGESSTVHRLPRRRPFLAAFLSFMPGLGNIYNGLYARGFSIFGIMWLLLSFTVAEDTNPAPFTVPCMIFLGLFNILDAYRQAMLINAGGATDLGLNDLPQFEKLVSSAFMPGVVMAVVGVYGAFKIYLDTDFGWVFAHWPVPVTLFGGWLIWQALRSQSGTAALKTQESEGT